jgi:hypothetical protein
MATHINLFRATKVSIEPSKLSFSDTRIVLENYEGDRLVIILECNEGFTLNPTAISDNILMPKVNTGSNEE